MSIEEELMDFFSVTRPSDESNASSVTKAPVTKDTMYESDELPVLTRQPTLNTDVHKHKAELAHKGSLAQRRRPASRTDLWENIFHTITASNTLMSDTGEGSKEDDDIPVNIGSKKTDSYDDSFKTDDRTDGMRIYMEANSGQSEASEETKLPLMKRLGVKLPALGQIGSVKLKKTGKLDMLKSGEADTGKTITTESTEEKQKASASDSMKQLTTEADVKRVIHKDIRIEPTIDAGDLTVKESGKSDIKRSPLNTEANRFSAGSQSGLAQIDFGRPVKSSVAETDPISMETDQIDMKTISVQMGTSPSQDIEMICSTVPDDTTPKVKEPKPILEPIKSAGVPVVARRLRNVGNPAGDVPLVTSPWIKGKMDTNGDEVDMSVKKSNQPSGEHSMTEMKDTTAAIPIKIQGKENSVVKPEILPRRKTVMQGVPSDSTGPVINAASNDLNLCDISTVSKPECMDLCFDEQLPRIDAKSNSTPVPSARTRKDPAEHLSTGADDHVEKKAKHLTESEDLKLPRLDAKSSSTPVPSARTRKDPTEHLSTGDDPHVEKKAKHLKESEELNSNNLVKLDHTREVASPTNRALERDMLDCTSVNLIMKDAMIAEPSSNIFENASTDVASRNTVEVEGGSEETLHTNKADVSEFIQPLELNEIEICRSDAFHDVPVISDKFRSPRTSNHISNSDQNESKNSDNLISMDLANLCDVSPTAEAMSLSIIVREQPMECSGSFSLSLDDIVSKNDPIVLDNLYGTNSNTSMCLKGVTTDASVVDGTPDLDEAQFSVTNSNRALTTNALNVVPEVIKTTKVLSESTAIEEKSAQPEINMDKSQEDNKSKESTVPSFYFDMKSEGKPSESLPSPSAKDSDNVLKDSVSKQNMGSDEIDDDNKFYFDGSAVTNQKQITVEQNPVEYLPDTSKPEIPDVDIADELEPDEEIHCQIESKQIESPSGILPESKNKLSEVDKFYFNGPSDNVRNDKNKSQSNKLTNGTGIADTIETIMIQPSVLHSTKMEVEEVREATEAHTVTVRSHSKSSSSPIKPVHEEIGEINGHKSDVYKSPAAAFTTSTVSVVSIPLQTSSDQQKEKQSLSDQSAQQHAVKLSTSPLKPVQPATTEVELPAWKREFDRKCRTRKASSTSQEIIAGRRFLAVATAAGCFALPKLRTVKAKETVSDTNENTELIIAPWQREWEEKKRRRSMADQRKT